MGYAQLIKIAIPFLLMAGIGIYIWVLKADNASLLDKNTGLLEKNTALLGEVSKAKAANVEQVKENLQLRENINEALTVQKLVLQKLDYEDKLHQERINVLIANSKNFEQEALSNSYVSGNRFNAWFNNWMLRVWQLRESYNRGSDPDGETVNNPGDFNTPPPAADRAIMVTMNSDYADQMQDNCDNSKFDVEGLVDDSLPGDPTFCNWYIVGLPGDRTTAFMQKMEEYYQFMFKQKEWGNYYKQATQHFKTLQENNQ